jgi:hypothetical protein
MEVFRSMSFLIQIIPAHELVPASVRTNAGESEPSILSSKRPFLEIDFE